MTQKGEEIDELLLETHGLLTGTGKENLYEVCVKLGTIPDSSYVNKSRLATAFLFLIIVNLFIQGNNSD